MRHHDSKLRHQAVTDLTALHKEVVHLGVTATRGLRDRLGTRFCRGLDIRGSYRRVRFGICGLQHDFSGRGLSRQRFGAGPFLGRSFTRESFQGQPAFGTVPRIVTDLATAFGAKHGLSSPIPFSLTES